MSLKENKAFLQFLISLDFKPNFKSENEFLYTKKDKTSGLEWLYAPINQVLVARPAKNVCDLFTEKHLNFPNKKQPLKDLQAKALKEYETWAWEFFSTHKESTDQILMYFYEPLEFPGKFYSASNLRTDKDETKTIENKDQFRAQFPRAYFFEPKKAVAKKKSTVKVKTKGVSHV